VKQVADVRAMSSRWLALTLTAGYVVVSVALGSALLAVPKADPAAARQATVPPTYVADDGHNAPPTTVTPAGFERVAGPANVATVIPSGWRIEPTDRPGVVHATDPAEASRWVGYGGTKVTQRNFAEAHIASESALAQRTSDYRRIDLSTATYAGHPAVQWEYQHDDGTGLRHVRSLYWRVAGTEYVVYASGPAAEWPQMQPIYDAMVGYSRP
jgi:hypothetical protein